MSPALYRALTWLASLLLILLALASGGLVANSLWQWLVPPQAPPVSIRTTDGMSTGPEAAPAVERIDPVAWFGEVPEAPPPAPEPAVEPAPEPPALTFRLQGVMASSDPARGSALIARRAGAGAELFRVGDEVFDQARLQAVYSGHVLLDRNGETVRLAFGEPENEAGDAPSSGAATRPDQSTGGRNTDAPSSSGTGGDRTPAASDERSRSEPPTAQSAPAERRSVDSAQARLEEEIRQAIDSVRARIDSDPQGLLRQYGLEATGDSYRVTPRAGILIANGLRPGDRITEINDRPVGNVERDLGLVDSVLSSDEIKITLERGGATYRIYQELPDQE